MNVLLEIVLQNDFLLDLFGIIGIGLIAMAAIRLAHGSSRNSGLCMAWGAIALLSGRIGMLAFTQFNTGMPLLANTLPTILLTAGLASIVWGFWNLEREHAEETATH